MSSQRGNQSTPKRARRPRQLRTRACCPHCRQGIPLADAQVTHLSVHLRLDLVCPLCRRPGTLSLLPATAEPPAAPPPSPEAPAVHEGAGAPRKAKPPFRPL